MFKIFKLAKIRSSWILIFGLGSYEIGRELDGDFYVNIAWPVRVLAGWFHIKIVPLSARPGHPWIPMNMNI